MNKYLIGIIVVCVLGGVVSVFTEKEPTDFLKYSLELVDYEETFTVNGVMVTSEYQPLTAPRGRYQKQVTYLYDEGEPFEKGDLIAAFDTSEIQDKLDEIEQTIEERELKWMERKEYRDLVSQEYDLRKQIAQYDIELQRIAVEKEKFSAKNRQAVATINKQDTIFNAEVMEKVAANAEKREERLVEQAQELLDNALEERSKYQKVFDQYEITAEEAGIVVYPLIWKKGIGWEVVALGNSLWRKQEFGRIPNLDTLALELKIDEIWKNQLVIGTKVRFFPKNKLGSMVVGQVIHVSALASVDEQRKHRKVFLVRVGFPSVGEGIDLQVGMTGHAKVVGKQFKQVFRVPREFVYYEEEQPYLLLLTDDGEVEKLFLKDYVSSMNFIILEPTRYPQLREGLHQVLYQANQES